MMSISRAARPYGAREATTIQPSLFPYEPPKVAERRQEKNGVVYTKPWVVDFILDLVGYTVDQPLHERLLVEPAAGEGSFLLRAVERLLTSCRRHGVPVGICAGAIRAFEIDDNSADKARGALRKLLGSSGVIQRESEVLEEAWVQSGDYLMETPHLAGKADFVVGNPPYIRLEELGELASAYRSTYPTMVGRADIYVAFYEAALRHLRDGGTCGFICADRWMFNQYGTELRRLITSNFSVEAVIQMHHADAFESTVSAYPAVTVIRKAQQGRVLVANLEPDAERLGAKRLAEGLKSGAYRPQTNVAEIERWFKGGEPWPLMQPQRLAALRRLESHFPTLEQTGCTVGIGVATGADSVFVTKDPSLVETDRLLPLAMAKDARHSPLTWSGHYLVNPWSGTGLVDLNKYPRLAAWFEGHRDQLTRRHVGQKAPTSWYRTIDGVNAGLATKEKLYLPDFKGRISPSLDRGKTYPHHNLYYIIPGNWDAEVLGGLLLSDVAQFFVEAYCVRMRGGFLRFQAQYLRRIRVPYPDRLSETHKTSLRDAFRSHDLELANRIATVVYDLTSIESDAIGHTETVS